MSTSSRSSGDPADASGYFSALVRIDPQSGRQKIAVPPTAEPSLVWLTLGADGRSFWAASGGNLVRGVVDDRGPDVGSMDSVLGEGLSSLVQCDGPCRGSVDVTLLRRRGARGAAVASAAGRVRVGGRRVQLRRRGYRTVPTRFSRRAKRTIRGQGRNARLAVTVRMRQRGKRRPRTIHGVVVLKRHRRR